MNKRQIESRIKNEINQIEVPDLRSQILAQVPNRKIKEPKKKVGFSLAFRLSPILAVLIICLLIIIGINQQPGDNGGEQPTDEIITTNISKVKKAYAKQAATVVGLADAFSSSVSTTSTIIPMNSSTNYQDVAQNINAYFNAVSKLLDDENVVYSLEELTSGNYQYKLTIVNNILNDNIETIIYYNESPKNNLHKKDDLDEISTDLDGIIEQDDNTYTFYGEKEVDEDECEIELIIKMSLDSYLKVSQEIEQHETEYEYEFYDGNPKNHEPGKKVSIEIKSNDKDKKDIDVEVEEGNEKYNISYSYKKGEKDHVDVKYHKGEDKYDDIKIHEDEERDDYYRYEFGEGHHEDVEKHHGKGGHKSDNHKTEDRESEDDKRF
jgi:hypothetical protein